MRFTSLVVLAASLFSVAHAITQTGPAAAVASPDGLIVPFSTLPACASLCGHLFDVQGACTPPVKGSIDKTCFCTDPRLTSILQGDAGVESACGAESCQDSASQQKIETWYAGYCNKQVAQPTGTATSTAATSTATSGSGSGSNSQNQNKSWYVSLRSSSLSSTFANMQRTGLRVTTDGLSSPLSSHLRLW